MRKRGSFESVRTQVGMEIRTKSPEEWYFTSCVWEVFTRTKINIHRCRAVRGIEMPDSSGIAPGE